MAKIVVLGAGLGGIIAAYEIRKTVRRQDEVIAVNETDYYQFVPSNPWVLVGWRDREDIVVDLEKPLKKRRVKLVVGQAQKVEPENKRLRMGDGSFVDYDYLVIATGPELAFDEIEGLGPNGYTQSVCHIDHAEVAYDKFTEFCEDPGPLIVGAVQGASCFGPAYETAMIIETELRRRKIRDKVPMTFVTSEPYIGHLGLGGVGDTKGLLESVFREHDIKWICNARVDHIQKDTIQISELDDNGQIKKGHTLPHDYSMLMPPFKGIPAVEGIEGLVNPRGFVIVDKHQANPAFPNVFAIGVCVAIAPPEKTPVPTGVPKTGFMIESMAAASARNIRALIDGREPTYEPTWNAVCLADFGNSGVGFVAIPQIPPRNINWSSRGRHIHLAKIAFEKYFLHKVRGGVAEPFYEKTIMKMIGVDKLKPLAD